MSFFEEERQHAATAARLKRAREEGDVAHSHELAIAIQMLAGVGALWFCAATIGNGLRRTTIGMWSNSTISLSPESAVATSQSLIWFTVRLVLPFLVAIFVVGTLAHLIQTRFLFNRPKLSVTSVSPQRWFRNLFSISGMGSLVIATPKVVVAVFTGLAAVWFSRDSIFQLGGLPTDVFANSLTQITAQVGMCVAVSLVFCSAVDYLMQWFSFQQRTRMTDQEFREEIRGQTGDPQIARIRHQRMREITRQQR